MKKYFAMAAAALALVACDKNNDDLGIDNTKAYILKPCSGRALVSDDEAEGGRDMLEIERCTTIHNRCLRIHHHIVAKELRGLGE